MSRFHDLYPARVYVNKGDDFLHISNSHTDRKHIIPAIYACYDYYERGQARKELPDKYVDTLIPSTQSKTRCQYFIREEDCFWSQYQQYSSGTGWVQFWIPGVATRVYYYKPCIDTPSTGVYPYDIHARIQTHWWWKKIKTNEHLPPTEVPGQPYTPTVGNYLPTAGEARVRLTDLVKAAILKKHPSFDPQRLINETDQIVMNAVASVRHGDNTAWSD